MKEKKYRIEKECIIESMGEMENLRKGGRAQDEGCRMETENRKETIRTKVEV